jgi:hypothetical protein
LELSLMSLCVCFHSLEDFLPLYHAHFTVHCLCRLHALKSHHLWWLVE